MTPIPAPSLVFPQEEWADTDFDLPEGDALISQSDAESDNEAEDWDVEMSLGKTGGAKAITSPRLASSTRTFSSMVTIRPAILPQPGEQAEDDDDDDDEGASTIKVTHMPPIPPKIPPPHDEDIETAFELPSGLAQLSLRPLSLHHRASKTSLEWGDRDHTSSSTSSDAYSSLGFGPSASPSSNSTSAPSGGELETDEDEDEDGELGGLVLPTGLFDSGRSARQLSKILEAKKRLPVVDERVKIASPDSEDDFEIGLVIDDDFDLSPSRLPSNRLQLGSEKKKTMSRSKSAPPRPPIGSVRPTSLLASNDRSKSPTMPISGSARSLRPSALPPTSSSRPTLTRKTTRQTLTSAPPSSHNSSFLQSPASGPLRAQKSHSVLKPPSPRGATSNNSHLIRKASLSSLIDTAAAAAGPSSTLVQSPTSYNAPTAASRARAQHAQTQFNPHSTTRLRAPDLERNYHVPPTRPCTPSSNTAALRLTMPTSSSRAKIRPAIASVFGSVVSGKDGRAPSPLPRPSSATSNGSSSRTSRTSQGQTHTSTATKILRRPKRARTYGDGTELDGIEDLPTDREREGRYRVLPRGASTPAPRLSKGSSDKDTKGTIGPKSGKREGIDSKQPVPLTNTLRRKERIDFSTAKVVENPSHKTSRKKVTPQTPSSGPSGTTTRKPTLIRNLGGAGPPKVVGDMKWNPQTLRWEGNDQALRDFDAATASSTRPALITHLTGSSIGSPVTNFAAGARVVGNMIFDPSRMCWISRLPPEEDEPDVFADLADDEEDDWDRKGGTIRACANQLLDQTLATAATRGDSPSPRRPTSAHSRAMSESGSERGARPALTSLLDVDGQLLEKCRRAEDRHRAEMKGWRLRRENDAEPDRSSLYEIRALATRQY